MFRAIQITKTDNGQAVETAELDRDDLPAAEVLVKIDYSTLNYKDALALTGASPVVRQFPMVPGIDFAGTVEDSRDERWRKGDRVILNGWGVGEGHWGGLSQYARVNGDWLIGSPQNLDTRQAMCIGTAGYTAALCINALVDHGVTPDDGEILVTGATGGVGSVAVALLAQMGYAVAASTGKTRENAYLDILGAKTIIDRATLSTEGKPLQKERWAGVVDAVGGQTLANACAQTAYRGAVTACGLAESPAFPATVMPFILRGVTLYGIDSVMAPTEVRERAWQLLADHLDTGKLESMVTELALDDAPGMAADILAGRIRGRLLVDVNR